MHVYAFGCVNVLIHRCVCRHLCMCAYICMCVCIYGYIHILCVVTQISCQGLTAFSNYYMFVAVTRKHMFCVNMSDIE